MRSLSILGLTALILICLNAVPARSEKTVSLKFSIEQEADIYEESDYGEPPQLAIWLEDPETGKLTTVYATYRTANGRFLRQSRVSGIVAGLGDGLARGDRQRGFPPLPAT